MYFVLSGFVDFEVNDLTLTKISSKEPTTDLLQKLHDYDTAISIKNIYNGEENIEAILSTFFNIFNFRHFDEINDKVLINIIIHTLSDDKLDLSDKYFSNSQELCEFLYEEDFAISVIYKVEE